MGELFITGMSLKKYMKRFGSMYESGELWDYPLDEISHILNDIVNGYRDINKFALIGDRLYEIN